MFSTTSRNPEAIVERFVCADCENRGCCTLETIIQCGSIQHLADKNVSVYDAYACLIKLAETEVA